MTPCRCSSNPKSRPLRRSWLAATLVCIAAACGGGDAAPEATAVPSGLVRLEWTSEGSAAGPTDRTVLHPPTADSGEAHWAVEGAQTTKVEVPPLGISEDPGLWMNGSGALTAAVPGPIPASVTGIDVEIFVRHRINVSVALVRREAGGEPEFLETLPDQLKSGSMAAETMHFRRLPSPAGAADFDELRVVADGGGGQVILFSVAWEQGRPEEGLPSAATGPGLAYLGKDGRRAIAITSSAPTRTTWQASPGHVLALDAGVPGEMYPKGLKPELHVRVTGSGDEVFERSFGLHRSTWKPIWVPLTGWTEGEVSVELSLSATRTAVALIGDARIVPAPVAGQPARQDPIVLLVSSDTHRADHLGISSDDPRVRTPGLDALAARGVRFTQAWSTANVTLPSHAALLTGTHPKDTGVINNATSLGASAETLAERFAEAGYGTFGAVSSRHLSHTISGFGQGFDRYAETGRGSQIAAISVGQMLRWIEGDWGRPIFAFLHLFDAHGPYEPPQEFARDLEGLESNPRLIALYAGEIEYVDQQLSRLFEHPRVQAGITAMTADHGESLGAHKIFFAHSELYPDTTHVPLLLAWPGAPQGLAVGAEVRQMDLGRTLLDLSGLGAKDFPGRNLLQWVEAAEAGTGGPTEATYALASGAQSAAIRENGWMLTLHLLEHKPAGSRKSYLYPRHFVELYHLAEDPGAARNLVHDERERARAMRAKLIAWLQQPSKGYVAEAAGLGSSDLEALQQLGYGGGDLDGVVAADNLFPSSCDCKHCERYSSPK